MKSERLRIAMISEHASPLAAIGGTDAGGQNVYVGEVARALGRMGHTVDIYTRRDQTALPPEVQLQERVSVLHVNAGPPVFVPKERLLEYMAAFGRHANQLLVQRGGYDVVHANFFMSGLVGLAMNRRFGVPLAVTFHALGLVRREHQGAADAFPAERIDVERAIVRHAQRLVAECPQDRSDLMRLYDARPERIATIPCGVDTALFTPGDRAQARRKLGLGDSEFIILQLGRLVPRKGIDNVVRALALLPRSVPARLVVVGGETASPDERATPEIGRLRALALELGVADRVTFTGHRGRANLPAFYVASNVFVTTPWYEAFGIPPLEAMACGRPVIGAAVGGIRHSVAPGITGFLVPPRDPVALADHLMHLYRHPALAHALGVAGVQRVRSRFTWDRVAEQLAAEYRLLADSAHEQARRAIAEVRGHAGIASGLRQ